MPLLQAETGDHICVSLTGTTRLVALIRRGVEAAFRDGHKMLLLSDLERGDLIDLILSAAPADDIGSVLRQVKTLPSRSTFVAGASFQQQSVLDLLDAELRLAHDQGFAVLRVFMDLRWVSRATVAFDTWCDYEVRANTLFAGGDLIGCCVYDGRNLTPDDRLLLYSAHTTTVQTDTFSLASRLRGRWSAEPPALCLKGETDLGNRAALRQLLASAARIRGPLTIDAADLEFVDAAALRALLGLAAGRATPTTIRCRPAIARLLHLFGACRIATLTVVVPRPVPRPGQPGRRHSLEGPG
ncbi:MEDS domain-containing protein [Dactylosporangium sp. NPDC050588]|uniref:MEDS domain-containing protein n=1 Tax=Dactylosporangium sp. NPDC050588 TaxID=3157211 RepID=UPI0033E7180B